MCSIGDFFFYQLYFLHRVNFKELTVDGKLLSGGQNRFDPSREFEQLDQERCGYISFDDAWGWLERKLEDAAAAGKGGLFGKKAAAGVEFCLNDILSVKSRVILTLFEKYEGRNSNYR